MEYGLGMDQQPVAIPNPNDPSIIFPPNPTDVQAWTRRDADALCQIVTSVKASVLTLIQHVNTAAEACATLKAQYEMTNATRKQNLETQLANEKMSDAESVEKFITRIKDLRDQMRPLGSRSQLKNLQENASEFSHQSLMVWLLL